MHDLVKYSLALLLLAGPACADAAPGPKARRDPDAFRVLIPLDGLDLATPAAPSELRKRARRLARRTCASTPAAGAYDQANVADCAAAFDAALKAALRPARR